MFKRQVAPSSRTEGQIRDSNRVRTKVLFSRVYLVLMRRVGQQAESGYASIRPTWHVILVALAGLS
jgi:hypothetical protein